MIKKLLLFVLIVISAWVAYAESLPTPTAIVTISTSGNTVKIDSTTNTVKMDATTNTVKDEAYATYSQSNTNSSTSLVLVTALTGRDFIEISAGPTAGQEIWVGVATFPAVGTGRCVTSSTPFKAKIPATVAVYTVASGAFPMSVIQAAY